MNKGGKTTKAKIVHLVAVLALILALAAAIVPASPVVAQTPTILTCNAVDVVSNGSTPRWFNLQTNDEVAQFTRPNVKLGSPATGLFQQLSVTGRLTGDLIGSFTQQIDYISIPGTVRPGYNHFGYQVMKGTVTCTSPSGSFDFVGVMDLDVYWTVPYDPNAHSISEGYWVSVSGTDYFADKILIGECSGGGPVNTTNGVATFRCYNASEITLLTPDTNASGTETPGNWRSISTLAGGTLLKLTGSPNYSTPTDNNTGFEDASGMTTMSMTSGPFAGGTASMLHNAVLYSLPPTQMGWSVAKVTYTMGDGNISAFVLTDITSLGTFSQIMFSKFQNNTGAYANKEYFATGSSFMNLTLPPPWLSSGTSTIFELSPPVPAHKTETTQPGTYIVDAKSEANTEVIKEGSGTPTITIARYSSNPGGSFQGDIGKYVDVFVPNTIDVDQIEIKLYYTDADIVGIDETTLKMYWMNGATWEPCSDTGVNTANLGPYSGYIWAHITSGSIPNFSYLSGQQFGGGGQGAGGAGGGGGGVPVFPSVYVGIGAALGAGILAYFVRRRIIHQR